VSHRVEVDGRTIEVGNARKVLFPDEGVTKLDLVEYYLRVAETMLPHLRDRPVTMHRFPDGINGSGFYQKDVPGHFPEWIRTVEVDKEGGVLTHVVCDDAATLAYLAEQACITPHVWLSTVGHPERPDRMIFDLDPPEDGGPEAVRFTARRIKGLLDALGLSGRIMTTGSVGFHVVVPLDGGRTFDEVGGFARRCTEFLARRHPAEITVEQRISKRSGRVFLDHLRNAYAQTTVAPYAVRAKPGAPVAVPIDWDELGSTEPQSYTVSNVFRRLGQKPDPWADDAIEAKPLDDAVARLSGLLKGVGTG
jgi:bifunctional non-homologous end joining protein LigD